jgi:predicted ATPase/DNA-binding winged helix-turn-helix (wHTH) protein
MPSLPAGATQGADEFRWRFGSFVLKETQRRVERAGEVLRLGSRSFELLLQLIKHAGDVMSKDELLATVWAGVVVEEASVRVQMSMLRKALGEPRAGDGCTEWISNIPLRGYRFNGEVLRERVDTASSRTAAAPAAPLAPSVGAPAPIPTFTKLPMRLTRLVGREADLQRLLSALDASRIVTLVGPGGIGKTRLAVRAAECHQASRASQIAFVDLSPLICEDHVPGTLARSLGAPADAPDTMQAIHQRLAGRDVLLLIDNCEHVADALAPLISGLLATLPRLRVLATSREAFRTEGEHVLRLAALAVPAKDRTTLAEAMRSPAVELLVERAQAAGARQFGDAEGALLARIARQVDGIPLAIELVAARLGVQSITDLALRLNDHMRLYSAGNAAVLARHRTLAAALDWSIALLNAQELKLFRLLSVFRGRFDLGSAMKMAEDDMDAEAAFDALISLANKSLIAFDNSDAVAPYRLLGTTRSYAAALLSQAGESPALGRRHAALMRDVMSEATAQLCELGTHAWAERYAHHLDDVRAALDGCLAPRAGTESDAGAGAKLGAALAIACAPLWFEASQIEEYRDRLLAAIACVERQPDSDTRTVAGLQVALANALFHTWGPVADMGAACERALAGALEVGAPALELQARWGLCVFRMARGEYAAALREARMLAALARASADPTALNLGHRIMSLACHFNGDFRAAKHSAEAATRLGDSGTRRSRDNIFQIDATVAAQVLLARTAWIQGDAPGALEAAARAVAHAEASAHAISLCFALSGAGAVALWAGETALARRWISLMLEASQRSGFVYWHRWAQCLATGLQAGAPAGHDRRMREAAARPDGFDGFDAPLKEMLVTFHAGWFDDDMLARASAGNGHWSAAEVFRAAGLRSERRGLPGEAEAFYLKAIETSRSQGALSWELRAVLELARLRRRIGGHGARAVALLDDICERAERFGDNPALARARALRAELRLGQHPLPKWQKNLPPTPAAAPPLRSYP